MTFLGLGGGQPLGADRTAGLFGALGCNLGSIPAYELGAWGGRRAVERYGKYILLNLDHLDQAHRFFERFGPGPSSLGRMLPVVRTFIALPAGIASMDRTRFHVFTFLGSLPWCLGLAWVGYLLGERWDTLGVYFHRFDLAHRAWRLAAGAALVRVEPRARRPAASIPEAREWTMGLHSGDGHGDP